MESVALEIGNPRGSRTGSDEKRLTTDPRRDSLCDSYGCFIYPQEIGIQKSPTLEGRYVKKSQHLLDLGLDETRRGNRIIPI